MTEAEQWAAYLAKPSAEREANERKVGAVYQRDGAQVARDMARALGMPVPPNALWSLLNKLKADRDDGSDEMRGAK